MIEKVINGILIFLLSIMVSTMLYLSYLEVTKKDLTSIPEIWYNEVNP